MSNNNNNCLFSQEEMDRMEPNNLFHHDFQKEPVTCLGMTFDSEDARREYFRKELRKKLPELKQIEGFPIGDDDDIINLSDPPYYTACPNPWLNDFIEEWEKEKNVLEKEGKRKASNDIVEPYAYGVKQGKNSAIYNAHSYHTKVPYEVIMRYILHYTQPGDVILDGFAGTGMTGVAAAACGKNIDVTKSEIESDFQDNGYSKPIWGKRHAVCGDLSPLCFHIASNYNSTVNVDTLKKAVDSIIEKLEKRFGYFYQIEANYGTLKVPAHINYFVWSEIVSCKNCGEELNVHDLSYDYTKHELKEKLTCPKCGYTQKRTEANSITETYFDEFLDRPISQLKYECCLANFSIPKHGRSYSSYILEQDYPTYEGFVPNNALNEGDKFSDPKRVGVNHVSQIYFRRTKYVLGYLYDMIQKSYPDLKKPLMFIFTSMLPKLTRMNRYMPQHGSRALVGPMANTLYIPPQCVENNPIDQFEYQATKVLKALGLCSDGNAIQICSANKSSLPNESIDYIFTDPPFGANIMYSELNMISESWLKVFTNNHEEAISNKTQHKELPEYQEIMSDCFREYYRVLKYDKWMTVEFSNTSASFWNCLQYAIKNAGFVIAAITDLNKERGGLHAMLGPTAVKQDLAISCYKPSELTIKDLNKTSINSIWRIVDSHLNRITRYMRKDGHTMFISERDPRIIYDRIISFYIQKGYPVPMDSQDFQKELKARYIELDGMIFTATQALEYEEKKKNAPEFVSLGIIVSDESSGIQWLKNQLRDTPKTYQELQPEWMQAINGLRKNDILPELKQILEENFIEMEGGKWRIPNIQDDVDKEALRTKSLLREFKKYVEVASKPKAKIKEARVEALRAGFKQCYIDKDFATIVLVGNKIPQNLRDEDEVLLQFYDIAVNKI